jgi:hypothetical protein
VIHAAIWVRAVQKLQMHQARHHLITASSGINAHGKQHLLLYASGMYLGHMPLLCITWLDSRAFFAPSSCSNVGESSHTQTSSCDVTMQVVNEVLASHPKLAEVKLKEVLGHTPRQVGQMGSRPCGAGGSRSMAAAGHGSSTTAGGGTCV